MSFSLAWQVVKKRVFTQTQSAVSSTTKLLSHLQVMLDKTGGSFARSHVVWVQLRALTLTLQKRFGKKLENVTLDATAAWATIDLKNITDFTGHAQLKMIWAVKASILIRNSLLLMAKVALCLAYLWIRLMRSRAQNLSLLRRWICRLSILSWLVQSMRRLTLSIRYSF